MTALPDAPAAFATAMIGQSLVQIVAYFALAGGLYLVVWRWGAARWAARRVQSHRRVDRAQIWFEVKHTVVTMLVGGLTPLALVMLQASGHPTILLHAPHWRWWEMAGAVVLLLVFNDMWFYACHRALHTRWLFKHVHAVHHRSIDTNPFTAYSFHAIEALVLGIWLIPLCVWVPLPAAVLGVTAVIGLLNNLGSHLGYEFFPAWLLRVPGLRWANTTTFHGLHHARSHGNYGLFTRVWDRLGNTELPGYEAAFTRAHRSEQKR